MLNNVADGLRAGLFARSGWKSNRAKLCGHAEVIQKFDQSHFWALLDALIKLLTSPTR